MSIDPLSNSFDGRGIRDSIKLRKMKDEMTSRKGISNDSTILGHEWTDKDYSLSPLSKDFTLDHKISEHFINFRQEQSRLQSLDVSEIKKHNDSVCNSDYPVTETYDCSFDMHTQTISSPDTPQFAERALSCLQKVMHHTALPDKMMNDENYKIRFIASLKLPANSRYNSDTHKFTINRKRKFRETNLEESYSIFKNKRFHSVKKIYTSTFPFVSVNPDQKQIYFNFYKDQEIGISPEWNSHLRYQAIDNDCDSDDNVLEVGVEESLISLKMGIEDFNASQSANCMLRNQMIINSSLDR